MCVGSLRHELTTPTLFMKQKPKGVVVVGRERKQVAIYFCATRGEGGRFLICKCVFRKTIAYSMMYVGTGGG